MACHTRRPHRYDYADGGYHQRRPHRALQLQPPRPDLPVADLTHERIKHRVEATESGDRVGGDSRFTYLG
jgi:hypothetical protein